MKKWVLLMLATGMVVLAGCGEAEEVVEQGKEEEVSQEIDEQYVEEVLAVLEERNDYANEQDIEGYLTFIPKDLQAESREKMEEAFDKGTVRYQIVDYHVEVAMEDEVVINVLQTVEALEEMEDFEDTMAQIRHVFKPEDGTWKIFESQQVHAEPYGNNEEPAEDINEESAEAALDVLHKNIEYANAEDIEGYLETVPEEEQEEMKEAVQEMFDEGQTEREIVDYLVLTADEEEVRIRVEQTTVAIDDIEGIEDNLLEIVHTLTLEDGAWKITDSEVTRMNPYEE